MRGIGLIFIFLSSKYWRWPAFFSSSLKAAADFSEGKILTFTRAWSIFLSTSTSVIVTSAPRNSTSLVISSASFSLMSHETRWERKNFILFSNDQQVANHDQDRRADQKADFFSLCCGLDLHFFLAKLDDTAN